MTRTEPIDEANSTPKVCVVEAMTYDDDEWGDYDRAEMAAVERQYEDEMAEGHCARCNSEFGSAEFAQRHPLLDEVKRAELWGGTE